MPSNYSLNFEYYVKEVSKAYDLNRYMAKNEHTFPTIVKICKNNRVFTQSINSFVISLHTEYNKIVSELYYQTHNYISLQKIFNMFHTLIDIIMAIIDYSVARRMNFLKVIIDIKYLILGQHVANVSLEDIMNIYFREEISKRIIKINN